MGITINVEEENKQTLVVIKKREKASFIDKTIKFILGKCKESPKKSLFGIDKDKKIKVERLEDHRL